MSGGGAFVSFRNSLKLLCRCLLVVRGVSKCELCVFA